MLEQDGQHNNLSYVHLWINTTRLYYEQSLIVSLLEDAIPRATPAPFVYHRLDRAIEAKIEFPFIDDFDALKDFLVPLYISLISAMHPILLQVIDLCRTPLSKQEKRAIIDGRDRTRISLSRRPKEELELFSRYCPQSWRPEILASNEFKCVHCDKPLTLKTAHMDHIIPWSIKPMRKKSNFQPLCSRCNAKKGNRHSH
jgi:HNH endonuclease